MKRSFCKNVKFGSFALAFLYDIILMIVYHVTLCKFVNLFGS